MKQSITIGRRGTITIPVQMRQELGLKAHDKMIIEDCEQGILLRPAAKPPIELYTEERIAEFAQDEEAVGEILKARE